ncbi:MAG: M50 family peptidase [Myxococcales bacterium]|nr:M50 family peptidase [Myxococcales bacterium]
MTSRRRRDLGTLLLALALVYAWNSVLLYPLKLVVVLVHELGHAAMAVATGGSVARLSVGADESGEVLSLGGNAILTLNAGYLGSLAWGLGLLLLTRRPGWSRVAAGAMAVLLVGVAAVWARPVASFGFVWVLVAAAGFAAVARLANDSVATLTLRVLGVFSVLYAVGDIVDDVLLRPGAPSDAAFLAARTGVPTLVWGLGWTAASLGAVWATLRRGG